MRSLSLLLMAGLLSGCHARKTEPVAASPAPARVESVKGLGDAWKRVAESCEVELNAALSRAEESEALADRLDRMVRGGINHLEAEREKWEIERNAILNGKMGR